MKKGLLFGLTVILCAGTLITGCGGKAEAYEKPIQTLCEVKQDNDLKTFLTLFGPMNSMMESVVTEDVFSKMTDNYRDTCGKGYKVSYKIDSVKKMSDDELTETTSNFNMTDKKFVAEEGYVIVATIKIKGSKKTIENKLNVSVAKSEGEWLFVNFDSTLLK